MQYKQFRYRKQPVSRTAALMLQALEYSIPKPEVQSNYGQARIIRTLVDRGWVERDGRTITDEGKRCWRYILERFERDDNEKPRPPQTENPEGYRQDAEGHAETPIPLFAAETQTGLAGGAV